MKNRSIVYYLGGLLTLMSFSPTITASVSYHHSCEVKEEQTSHTALACNIYHEARGESMAGQLAVGHVTLNRLDSKRNFGQRIQDVVYKYKQFSWTNDEETDRVYELAAWGLALKYASIILARKTLDFTEGSLFYHRFDLDPLPYWVDVNAFTLRVDNHIMYNNDKKA
jgi:N-acetylmuramoyl-L-alanine amidase